MTPTSFITGPVILALRHARHNPARSVILTACIAIAFALPLTVRILSSAFERSLTARAASTPLLIGARGNRFDLAMAMLYFRRAPVSTISMADAESLAASGGGVFIPMNVRFTARHKPIVATTPDYHLARDLTPVSGTLPLTLGDAALGSRAAAELALTTGDALFSDQRELFDIAKPQALKMRISGVLARTDTPDDDAVFVDLKTAWILEGLSHAHIAPASAPAGLVLDRRAASVTLSEQLIDFNEVTDANRTAFHLHATPDLLPLTGVLVLPDSAKSATILATRHNAGKALQAVIPAEVVRELLAYVFRVRSLLDAVAALVAALTIVLLALVTALSIRVRAREISTLRKLGASSLTIASLFASELGVLLLLGATAGAALALLASSTTPDLLKLLSHSMP